MDDNSRGEVLINESDTTLDLVKDKKFIGKNARWNEKFNIETIKISLDLECDPNHLVINEETILINESCIVLNS